MSYPIVPSSFKRLFLQLPGCLLLLAASVAYADSSEMTRILQQHPTLAGFEICHSGGCADVSHVALAADDWQQVRAVFEPMPGNAEDERKCIANAIGVMETLVGEKTGTSTDRGGTFGNSAYPGQMDCNDEAINSTTYMKLMQQDGLINFHEILDTKRRGFFINGWPHSTAAIKEITGGQSFAVDSWFYDNGVPAETLPLELWKSGWKPEHSSAH